MMRQVLTLDLLWFLGYLLFMVPLEVLQFAQSWELRFFQEHAPYGTSVHIPALCL